MRQNGRPSVDELFAAAVALEGGERSRYLDSRCARDSSLRSEVEDLLRYHEEAGDFLEVPPITALPAPAMSLEHPVVAEAVPERIGSFRIERVLGVGGPPRVYLAESEQPRRWVALKVVKSGLGSGSMRRRFEQEAQVVALLQHPGIAQLYEAGTADSGDGAQPFFAMEYVDGPMLTEYARRKELSTRERLELFCRVCDAADHAHRRGVVHRDLKPGNILVDATGQPKILDFGVARLTDPETGGGAVSAVTTLHTQAGQLIGTLSYMSPEQVAGKPGEVDARSDVYSLGVILFELLTGRLPHNVSSSSIPEAIRAIREDAPTSLSSIDRSFRGDIETIVGRALEKEAPRRYQSAAELAGDLRRSLRDEPIEARPPSTWYQLSKFAKRNKALVGGVAATIMALAGGLVVSVWQARAAEEARREAEARETEARLARGAAIDSKKTAEEALQVSNEINRFLEQLFSSPDPDERLGQDVTVMEVLDRSARQMEGAMADQPQVRAALHRTIGGTYRSLTEFAKAEQHLRAAYDIYVKLYGERHEETLASMTQLVLLLSEQARRKEALALAEHQWEIAKEFFPEDRLERLTIASNLAAVKLDVGDWRGAEALQRYVMEGRGRVLPADDPTALSAKNNLARTLARTGRLPEAVKMQREVVAAFRASGRPIDTLAFTAILSLANSLIDAHEDDEAGVLARELMEKGAELFSPEHNAMLAARNVHGLALLHEGQLDEAAEVFRQLIESHRKNEVPAVEGLVRAQNNLGEVLRAKGKLDEAEAQYREALAIMDRHELVPDRLRLGILNNLATTIRLRKDYEGVLPVYKELVETSEAVLPPGDTTIAVGKYGYAVVLGMLRRGEESEAQLQGAYDILMKSFDETDERVITVMRSFVDLYTAWQKPEKAEYWRRRLPEKYR